MTKRDETHAEAGPWFLNHEGRYVAKRQLFDEDGNPAGYQLLDGDYDAFNALLEAAEKMMRWWDAEGDRGYCPSRDDFAALRSAIAQAKAETR